MSKPNRNDPCYCGSGKKYKKCHMKADQAVEKEQRDVRHGSEFLRRDFLKFARDERFAKAFAAALPFYWNEFYDADNAEEMSQPEALRFFDWFVFDYEMEDGKRPLTVYHEDKFEDLSTAQQNVLDSWMEAGPATVYEMTGYEGPILQLKEFMTGEEVAAYEGGGRGAVDIGDIILTRLVQVGERLEFSTDAAYLPADEIQDLKEKLEAAKTADSEKHPNAPYEQFMRRHSHLLVHHALEQAERKGRPPVARLDPNRPDKMVQAVAHRVKKRFK